MRTLSIVVTKENKSSRNVALILSDSIGTFNANHFLREHLPICDQKTNGSGNCLRVKSRIADVVHIFEEKYPTLKINVINAS